MQNLPNQFNVYDVLSYLIPGFIAICFLCYYVFNQLINILIIEWNIN